MKSHRCVLATAAALFILSPVFAVMPPLGGPEVRINQDPAGTVQNETSLTLNPAWPGNIVVAYNDQPWPGGPGLGVSFSIDNGATWTDRQLPYPAGMVEMFDPLTAADTAGGILAACVGSSGIAGGPSGIFVYRSLNGGNNWSIIPGVAGSAPNRLCENPHMAVDTNAVSPFFSRVYVSWIEDFATTGSWSDILFNTSVKNNLNFVAQQRISDLPPGVSRGNGSNVAAGPDGTVYVVWMDCDVVTGGQVPGILYLDRSFDGGVTWAPGIWVDSPRQIMTLPNMLTNLVTGGQDAIARSYPSMAVSPLNSLELYIVYAEDPDSPFFGDEADVFFIKSNDGVVDANDNSGFLSAILTGP